MMIVNKILLERKKKDYTASLCILQEDLTELHKRIHILHSNEYFYFKNLQFDKRKQSYLLGRVSAKEAVKLLLKKDQDYKDFFIDFGIFQFPVVKGIQENIQVSISHCNNYGASLAFPEDHPMGIDIEKVDVNQVKTIESSSTHKEKEHIKSHFINIADGYTTLWTIKEALSKVIKTGFTIDPKILEIKSISKTNNTYTSEFEYFNQYKAISFIVNSYAFTIVLPRNTSIDLDPIFNSLKGIQDV